MKQHSLNLYLLIIGLSLSILFGIQGYSDTRKLQPLKQCALYFDNKVILHQVPLAESNTQRRIGLSGDAPTEKGMLFIFEFPQHLSFWMKNTHTPLSIGFFNSDNILSQIEDMQAYSETLHVSRQKSTLALELPIGQFQQLHLTVGTQLQKITCK